jgi:uncharacterized protein YndB with AHSA1/START domain
VRRLPAAPEKAFKAWTDQRELAQWMGPADMAISAVKVDAREAGGYRITMRSEAGKEFTAAGAILRREARGAHREDLGKEEQRATAPSPASPLS